MRHPTIRTIVLIDPDLVDVLVYTRADDGSWQNVKFDQHEQVFVIPGTGAVVRLSDIYDGVPLAPAAAAQAAAGRKSAAQALVKAWAPRTISSSDVFSVQWCEMPPIEGTNSMPAGITFDRIWAS
jgi:hypothetical protein